MNEPTDTTHQKKTAPAKAAATSGEGEIHIPRVIAAVVIGLLLLWLLFFRGGGNAVSTRIGDTDLNEVRTYLSKSNDDPDRKAQSSFKVGDPIQVGFTYELTASDDADTQVLVQFAILGKDSAEVLKTNTFKLDPQETELFVSINNASLPAGDYTIEVQDGDGSTSATVDYSIKE